MILTRNMHHQLTLLVLHLVPSLFLNCLILSSRDCTSGARFFMPVILFVMWRALTTLTKVFGVTFGTVKYFH